MLIGRDSERARIQDLLAGASQGRSGVLVLHGESGVGKSALLGEAADKASGMRLLRVTCTESEAEIAFTGLADLLRPVMGRMATIPAPQAAALTSVLAIGPTLAADRFTYCAATLSLLASAAEDGGLLAIVDDAQWMDSASLDAVLFAARRLHAEGVGVLLAARDQNGSTFDRRGLPDLYIGALSRSSALQLLHQQFDLAGAVAETVVASVGSNPLALLESVRLLSPTQRAGIEILQDPLPLGASLGETLAKQLGTAPAEVARALLCAAASADEEIEPILSALESLGINPQALESAEALGFVTIESGRLRFRHPALRSATYHSAAPDARRSAHRALAGALGEGGDPDRHSWHLAAAAVGPVESTASALEATATRARLRGGYVAAALALQQAAQLSPVPEHAARRFLAAAEAARIGGRAELALTLSEHALRRSHDPLLTSDIHLQMGLVRMWTGAPMAAHDLLVEQAGSILPSDPTRAALLLAMAVPPCYMSGSLDRGLVTARRAHELARHLGGFSEAVASLQLAFVLGLRGEVAESQALMQRGRDLLPVGPFAWETAELTQLTGHLHIWTEDYQTARPLLEGLVDKARSESVLSVLPYLLATLSELDFRVGRWATALANATESARLADELGQRAALAFSAVCAARIEGARGNVTECVSHAQLGLLHAKDLGLGSIFMYADAALGLLHLGLGRPAAAIQHLERVARSSQETSVGEPGVIQWAPDLIESYVRLGQQGEALAALAAFEEQVERTKRPGAQATAARCRGLVHTDDPIAFEQALSLHVKVPAPFETARTELCLAESLLRRRRRAEADVHLESALDVFQQLGAQPWADRARGHLERRRTRMAAHSVRLSPSELQVALAVATGFSNKEAAMRLFLSPKTVEAHLTSVYAKLEIRSRSQLARIFALEQEHTGAA